MSETPEIIDHVDNPAPEISDAPLITVNVPKLKAGAKKVGRSAAKFAVPALLICGLAYVKGVGDTVTELESGDEDDESDSDSDTDSNE